MTTSDLDLLKQYARDSSQDAFAEIVRRHLDLVHSAALRQVRSPQLAEEVAQSAFTDLARQSQRLAPDTIVTAWLYEVTRRTAIDVVRREARRQLREQIALEMNAMNATTTDWAHVEPLLDEAMHALDETDRAAVLLRYFENKSLREVGQALGTSDDTAQKRVSRAVDRLREFFAQRGVTVGASGLVIVISAHAVQAAPIGLSAATAAGALAAASAVATLTQATIITMNWLNAKSAAAILAAAIVAGIGVYSVQQHRLTRADVANLALLAQQQQLTSAREEALATARARGQEAERLRQDISDLPRLRGEVTRLRAEAQATRLLGGVPPFGKTPLVAGLSINHVGPVVAGQFAPPVLSEEYVRTNISVQIGTPYNRMAIDRDVRALNATGLFANVRVSEEKTNEDFILTYSVQDKSRAATPGTYVPKEQLAPVGYASPEAALQTITWAMMKGTYEQVSEGLRAEEIESEAKDPKAREGFETRQKVMAPLFKGFQIVARKMLADDRVELKVRMDVDPIPDQKRQMPPFMIQPMVKVGGSWRLGGSTRGHNAAWESDRQIQTFAP